MACRRLIVLPPRDILCPSSLIESVSPDSPRGIVRGMAEVRRIVVRLASTVDNWSMMNNKLVNGF
jgi:hypothetical protein